MNTITTKFMNTIKEDTKEIDKSIELLQEQIKGLEQQIAERGTLYDLKEMKVTQGLQNDVNSLNDLLGLAKQDKSKIVEKNADKVFTEAYKLIMENRKAKQKKHDPDIKAMIDKIEEVRTMQIKFTEVNDKYSQEEKEFVKEVLPYVSTVRVDTIQPNSTTPQSDRLLNVANLKGYNSGTSPVMRPLTESELGVQGLFKPYKHRQ